MKHFGVFFVALFVGNFVATAATLEDEKSESNKFVEEMAKESGATVLAGGVVIRPVYHSGSLRRARLSDKVKVSYHLADRNKNALEISYLSGDEIASFPLHKLIRCWQVAVPKIPFGSQYKVTCPAAMAYGDKGAGDGLIKPGAALVFWITLFGVE